MKVIGHRGARGLAPENTVIGMQKALEHHVDELEFDLRVTKDGIVILSHGRNISDQAGNELRISGHNYEELKSHKPDLATFEDVLKIVNRRAPLHIEVKAHEPVAPIVAIIKKYLADGWKSENFLLASKHQKTLLQLHQALPEVQTVVVNAWSGVQAAHRARQLGTKRISMNHHWLWWGFIASVHRGGYELYAYTLNDPVKARKWAKRGLAGVITDFPDRFEH